VARTSGRPSFFRSSLKDATACAAPTQRKPQQSRTRIALARSPAAGGAPNEPRCPQRGEWGTGDTGAATAAATKLLERLKLLCYIMG